LHTQQQLLKQLRALSIKPQQSHLQVPPTKLRSKHSLANSTNPNRSMVTVASAPSPPPPPYPPSRIGPPSSPPATPVRLPRCCRCGANYKDLERFVTKTSNRNGKSGRPYLKCIPCNKFVTWLDDRGIDDECPTFPCNFVCRRQVAGKYGKINPRVLHYVCGMGTCDYYEICRYEDGGEQVTTDDLVDLLARMRMI